MAPRSICSGPNRRRAMHFCREEVPQRPFGGIVGQTDATVVEEGREPLAVLEHMVDRLGCRLASGQSGSLGAHPFFNRDDDGPALPAAFKAFVDGKSADLALDVEHRVNAFDRFESNRRYRRGVLSTPGVCRDVREHEVWRRAGQTASSRTARSAAPSARLQVAGPLSEGSKDDAGRAKRAFYFGRFTSTRWPMMRTARDCN